MNKKSHISLAQFLIDYGVAAAVTEHEKAFMLGSILPDCVPSFLTRRHTIAETFDLLKSEIRSITVNYETEKGITAYFCRHLGIICHYLADYFTFPHNPGYNGSMKEHWDYEKELIYAFRMHLDCEKEKHSLSAQPGLNTTKDISDYILQKHEEYLQTSHDIKTDCFYITEVCFSVVQPILEYSRLIISSADTQQVAAA